MPEALLNITLHGADIVERVATYVNGTEWTGNADD